MLWGGCSGGQELVVGAINLASWLKLQCSVLIYDVTISTEHLEKYLHHQSLQGFKVNNLHLKNYEKTNFTITELYIHMTHDT
jgi:hypothetical protein